MNVRPQHQGSLREQLDELRSLAIKHGLYDAADWLDRVPFRAKRLTGVHLSNRLSDAFRQEGQSDG